MTHISFPIPSLVQGVSQQAPQQARPTQSADEVNRINSVVEGNSKRTAFEHLRFLEGENFEDAFFVDIIRSREERHRVIIDGGAIRAFDLLSGEEATVAMTAPAAYLAHTGPARTCFRVCQVADALYVVNTQIHPAMATARSPIRPPEAFVYFRAGNYSTTYAVSITFGGSTYTWSIGTPDASNASHEAYIRTNYLADRMYLLLTADAAGDSWAGSSKWGGGGVTYTASPGTITGMGFSVAKNNNVLRIWRNDGQDFTLETSDGQGDTYLIGMKEHASKFSDLPAHGWHGAVLKIRGQQKEVADDYWVRYNAHTGAADNEAGSTGVWEECPAPDTVLGFDAATMPHYLMSLGGGAFDWKQGVWSTRVAGDGVESAKNPSFVGRRIEDIFFERGRLGFITEGSVSYSKSRQYFTFFPDTIQTVLDTDTIDDNVAGTDTAVLKWALAFNEQMLLWADGVQYGVKANDTLSQKTIETKPTTYFKIDAAFKPSGVGNYVHFATRSGRYSKLWEFYLTAKGLVKTASETTAQCPRYVPADVAHIAPATDQHLMLVLSAAEREQVSVYNFFFNGDEKVQSAWGRWTFRPGLRLLFANFVENILYATFRSPHGVHFETLDCGASQADPDGGSYRTRLDSMVSEQGVSDLTFDGNTGWTGFTLPYPVDDAEGLQVVVRAGGAEAGGRELKVVAQVGSRLWVKGDLTQTPFYVGWRIPSSRTFPQFWPRTEQGVQPFDRVQVHSYRITYANSGYLRAAVAYETGESRAYEMVARRLGSPTNRLGRTGIQSGEFKVPVKSENTRCTITIFNDSPFPDHLQGASVQYHGALRVRPGATGGAGK